MRNWLVVAVVVPVAGAGWLVLAADSASPMQTPTMSCANANFQAESLSGGYRVVLGRVGVGPARYPGKPEPEAQYKPFRYFAKEGVWVLTGSPSVTLTVPAAWRKRAAISWEGIEPVIANRVYSSVRIAPCPAPPSHTWVGFGGGFYVTAPACVPLIVTMGGRSEVVHFGIGAVCKR